MKRICVVAAVALPLLVTGCKEPVAEEEEPAAPAHQKPVAAATPEPPPAPAAPVAAATPAPAAPELAPPGVFYLLSAARVETSAGLTGLPPGTGVKLVRPGIYLTPAGEVPLREDQLTNDMALARRALQADRAVQAAAKARVAADGAAIAAAQTRVAPSAAPPADAAEEAKAKVREQIAALDKETQLLDVELSRVYAELRSLSNDNPRTSPAAARLYQRRDALRERQRQITEQRVKLSE